MIRRDGVFMKRAFACVAWVLLWSGCGPKYYVPNTHNAPLLRQKGEAALSFAAGEWRAEFQGAHAATHHTALMLNGSFFHPEDDEEGDGGKGQLVEVGLGYYRMLPRKIAFETYGLLGIGHVENHFPSTLADHPSTTGEIESTLWRYGIQPALGFRSRYLDAAVSARITGLHYGNLSGNLVFAGEDQVAYLRRKSDNLLVEPALTLRMGYDFLKLQMQLGHSFNVNNPAFRQDKGHFTVGIGITWTRTNGRHSTSPARPANAEKRGKTARGECIPLL